MKKNTLFALFVFFVVFTLVISATPPNLPSASKSSQKLIQKVSEVNINTRGQTRIMTYNLLADSAGFEGTNAFERADGICRLINTISPDVLGLQEVSRNWYYCLKTNTDYKFIRPIKTAVLGTMTTIIYNSDTLSLLCCGEKAFTSTPQSRLRQIVWGVFSRKEDGATFCLVNTHLSLSNEDWSFAIKQAQELIEEINQLSYKYRVPVFITGDFNSGKRKSYTTDTASVYETISTVADDTKNISNNLSCGDGKSIHSVAIDHIFLRGNATINEYTILSQRELANFSDHYPVFIDISL